MRLYVSFIVDVTFNGFPYTLQIYTLALERFFRFIITRCEWAIQCSATLEERLKDMCGSPVLFDTI